MGRALAEFITLSRYRLIFYTSIVSFEQVIYLNDASFVKNNQG